MIDHHLWRNNEYVASHETLNIPMFCGAVNSKNQFIAAKRLRGTIIKGAIAHCRCIVAPAKKVRSHEIRAR